MNNKELLRCPFCGGEVKIENRGQYGYGIVCISCGAKSPDFQTKTGASKSWNAYANDLLKTEQSKPEISLDGIHPDLINGLLEAKRNYPEKQDSSNSSERPNSSKEQMPLIPEWKVIGKYKLNFLTIKLFYYNNLDFQIDPFGGVFRLWVSINNDIRQVVGEFNTLKEAKAKVNECIRELGEKLVYFADKIKTTE